MVAIVREQYRHTCTTCGGAILAAKQGDEDAEPSAAQEQVIKQVYNGDLKAGDIDPESVTNTANRLMDGVQKGYGMKFGNIDYDTPHYNMLANLERNVYQFSGAKNYQMLKDLTLALKDGDKLRSRPDFKKEAMKIMDEYDGAHLDTEYNTAINGALNAAKWVDIQKNASFMPNLKYITAGDSRVRDEHKLLDGVIRPVNDSFWDTHYPPLAFNCRCTIGQVPGNDPVTPKEEIPAVEIPKMFQVNLAKENIVFPTGSAYFTGVPAQVKDEVFNLLPFERRYEVIHEREHGFVKRHADVDTKSADYKTIERIALNKADNGYRVEILPEIDPHETDLRKRALKGTKPNKSPDMRINGQYVEVKQPETPYGKNTISNNIKNAVQQANHVIIELTDKVEKSKLKSIAAGRLKTHETLKSIEFTRNGKPVLKVKR